MKFRHKFIWINLTITSIIAVVACGTTTQLHDAPIDCKKDIQKIIKNTHLGVIDDTQNLQQIITQINRINKNLNLTTNDVQIEKQINPDQLLIVGINNFSGRLKMDYQLRIMRILGERTQEEAIQIADFIWDKNKETLSVIKRNYLKKPLINHFIVKIYSDDNNLIKTIDFTKNHTQEIIARDINFKNNYKITLQKTVDDMTYIPWNLQYYDNNKKNWLFWTQNREAKNLTKKMTTQGWIDI